MASNTLFVPEGFLDLLKFTWDEMVNQETHAK